jgi:hypothetical protein
MPAMIRTLFEEELSENFVQSMRDAGDYGSELQIGINKKNLLDLKDKGMIVAEVNKADPRKPRMPGGNSTRSSARAFTRR